MQRGPALVAGAAALAALAYLLTRSASAATGAGFDIGPYLRSATADRLGLDNTPTSSARASLQALDAAIVAPLRARIPGLIITSGYRSPAVNAAIPGASATSQHSKGEAVDLSWPGHIPAQLGRVVWNMAREGLPVDQVIVYTNTTHVHISHKRNGSNRAQFLTGPTGGPYTPWSP